MEHIRELREFLDAWFDGSLPYEAQEELEEILEAIEDEIDYYKERVDSLNKVIAEQEFSMDDLENILELCQEGIEF